MNAALRMLYRAGAWLSADEAAAVSKHGCLHLRSYKRLAELSLHKREPRYPIHCKAHMLHHTFRILEQKCQALCWLENPIVDSCQIDESFVGILSRYSRRVSPKTTVHRTYDLYLTALKRHLMDRKDE